jgi:uncharacterized membrane protein (DUF106 family)
LKFFSNESEDIVMPDVIHLCISFIIQKNITDMELITYLKGEIQNLDNKIYEFILKREKIEKKLIEIQSQSNEILEL